MRLTGEDGVASACSGWALAERGVLGTVGTWWRLEWIRGRQCFGMDLELASTWLPSRLCIYGDQQRSSNPQRSIQVTGCPRSDLEPRASSCGLPSVAEAVTCFAQSQTVVLSSPLAEMIIDSEIRGKVRSVVRGGKVMVGRHPHGMQCSLIHIRSCDRASWHWCTKRRSFVDRSRVHICKTFSQNTALLSVTCLSASCTHCSCTASWTSNSPYDATQTSNLSSNLVPGKPRPPRESCPIFPRHSSATTTPGHNLFCTPSPHIFLPPSAFTYTHNRTHCNV